MMAGNTRQSIRRGASIVGLSIALFFVFNWTLMFWQLNPITVPDKYELVVRHRWLNATMIEHFPAQLPVNAQDVRLYYIAGFLQGGARLELRMRLPLDTVDEIASQYRSDAIAHFDASGEPVEADTDLSSSPKFHFSTVALPELEASDRGSILPGDYEIFLLYARMPVDMNHPHIAGLAFSRTRSEVIYWAEDG